jgi:hypothetical protein
VLLNCEQRAYQGFARSPNVRAPIGAFADIRTLTPCTFAFTVNARTNVRVSLIQS